MGTSSLIQGILATEEGRLVGERLKATLYEIIMLAYKELLEEECTRDKALVRDHFRLYWEDTSLVAEYLTERFLKEIRKETDPIEENLRRMKSRGISTSDLSEIFAAALGHNGVIEIMKKRGIAYFSGEVDMFLVPDSLQEGGSHEYENKQQKEERERKGRNS